MATAITNPSLKVLQLDPVGVMYLVTADCSVSVTATDQFTIRDFADAVTGLPTGATFVKGWLDAATQAYTASAPIQSIVGINAATASGTLQALAVAGTAGSTNLREWSHVSTASVEATLLFSDS